MEQGWRAFLVKVHNQAGVTAVLAVDSPNAGLSQRPEGAERVRWMDLQMANKQPMKAHLSGLEVEYRVLQLYAKEAGKREAKLASMSDRDLRTSASATKSTSCLRSHPQRR